MLPGDAVLRIDDPLGSDATQAHDDLGLHQGHLLTQIPNAGILLFLRRVPVLRRAALDDIGDIAILASIQIDDAKHLIQQFSRGAYERLTLQVLLLSRAFPDEHYICFPLSYTEDHTVPSPTQVACRTAGTGFLQFFPCAHISDSFADHFSGGDAGQCGWSAGSPAAAGSRPSPERPSQQRSTHR